MSDQKPMTPWKQCKTIAEALSPNKWEQHEAQMMFNRLLAQIAEGGEKGAALAARLAEAKGPIEVAFEDIPEEFVPLAIKAYEAATQPGSAGLSPKD
jgi:hypothetical protein